MGAADVRFCREVTRRSASSFYHAFRVLPVERRDALYAVYAFCRAVDDAADESDRSDAPALLDGWRRELERCYRGMPLHPVTIVLSSALERFPIPFSALSDVLDGVEMDLRIQRYGTFEELEVYCRRVASAVGRSIGGLAGVPRYAGDCQPPPLEELLDEVWCSRHDTP
jgi:phytoene synthase